MRWTAIGLLTTVALAIGCPTAEPTTSDGGTGSDAVPPGAADASARDALPIDAAPASDAAADAGALDAERRTVDVVLAYSAATTDPNVAHLFLTRSSTARAQVTPALAGGVPTDYKGEPRITGVVQLEWARDGSGLIYRAQQDTYDVRELYFAPTPDHRVTGVTHKLSAERGSDMFAEFGRLLGTDFVVFNQPDDGSFSSVYAVRTATGARPVRLNAGPFAAVESGSPTAPQLLFQDTLAGERDLWFADLGVHPPHIERINVGAHRGFGGVASWAPDGRALLYTADDAIDGVNELYRVAIEGGALGPRTRVIDPLPLSRDVTAAAYSPDGATIALVGDLSTDGAGDLYTLDARTSTLTRLSSAARGDVARLHFSADGQRILYVADHDATELAELFVARVGVAGSGTRVSSGIGGVGGERWLGDRRVLYWAGPVTSRRFFIADLSGAAPAAPVTFGPATTGVAELSRSGRYLLMRDDGEPSRLFLVDLSASPTTAVDLGLGSAWCWGPGDALALVTPSGRLRTTALYLIEDLADPQRRVEVSGPIVDTGSVWACAFPP